MELAKEMMYKFPLYNDLVKHDRFFLDYGKNFLALDISNKVLWPILYIVKSYSSLSV